MIGSGAEPRSSAAPSPVAADVGIVAALGLEIGFLTDRLKRVRRYAGPRHKVVEGEVGGKLVALIVGGAGRESARQATRLLIDGHRPRWVVSAGFAGALDPSLRRNDVVLPDEVLDLEGRRYPVGVVVPTGNPHAQRLRLFPGKLLTVDTIIRESSAKALLRERYGADLVDMESSAVAAVCNAQGLRFLAVRVVSDEAADELPQEVVTLMNRQGSRLVGSALRAIWKRPSALKDFLSLHNHAQEAADRLADVILAVVDRLPA